MGGNVIAKDDRISGIIDFDDAAYSPCVLDLGYTLWDILFDKGEKDMRSYLASYQQARTLSAPELEVLPQCIMSRNYMIGATDLFLGIRSSGSEMGTILQLEKEIPLLKM
jgi:Ser/Thr protein kinase RdoA (MazF antagonist)